MSFEFGGLVELVDAEAVLVEIRDLPAGTAGCRRQHQPIIGEVDICPSASITSTSLALVLMRRPGPDVTNADGVEAYLVGAGRCPPASVS